MNKKKKKIFFLGLKKEDVIHMGFLTVQGPLESELLSTIKNFKMTEVNTAFWKSKIANQICHKIGEPRVDLNLKNEF